MNVSPGELPPSRLRYRVHGDAYSGGGGSWSALCRSRRDLSDTGARTQRRFEQSGITTGRSACRRWTSSRFTLVAMVETADLRLAKTRTHSRVKSSAVFCVGSTAMQAGWTRSGRSLATLLCSSRSPGRLHPLRYFRFLCGRHSSPLSPRGGTRRDTRGRASTKLRERTVDRHQFRVQLRHPRRGSLPRVRFQIEFCHWPSSNRCQLF